MDFKTKDLLVGLATNLAFKSGFLRDTLADLGEAASFNSFIRTKYPQIKHLKSREKLYSAIHEKLNHESRVGFIILEFGVAQGNGTKWWSRKTVNQEMEYIGFDTFTGLPQTWIRRGVVYREKGFFDQKNSLPSFPEDSRISFCVGMVQDNSDEIVRLMKKNGQKIILLDLDLYDPTLFVWKTIEPLLKKGDIVYFDEGFDSDGERRIIADYIFTQSSNWEYLGNSSIAIAFMKTN